MNSNLHRTLINTENRIEKKERKKERKEEGTWGSWLWLKEKKNLPTANDFNNIINFYYNSNMLIFIIYLNVEK